jgi:hypothetical protein
VTMTAYSENDGGALVGPAGQGDVPCCGQPRRRRKSVRKAPPPEADELGTPHPDRLRLLREKYGAGPAGED